MKNIPLILFSLALVACESSDEKALKEFVSSQFKDPQSTQFQKITFKDGVMCGEVNSKNGYGAYVGFKRFVAEKKTGDFSGNVEDVGIIGKEISLTELSVYTFLVHTRLNLLREKANQKTEDYFDYKDVNKTLLKYVDRLKQFEKKYLSTAVILSYKS